MYLIDTNIISELTKLNPNRNVVRLLETIERPELSIISLSELKFGINTILSKNKRSILLHWFDNLNSLAKWHPINEEIADLAALLRSQSQKKGVTLTLADALIAATAIFLNLTLLTRNTKDFKGISLNLLNPFSP